MTTYRKRESTNPDVWVSIQKADIQHLDFIETKTASHTVRAAWQHGAPVAPPPTHLTSLEPWIFFSRFTASEFKAIDTLAKENEDVFQFWVMANSATTINLKLEAVIKGMTYLSKDGPLGVSAPLTGARKDEILLGVPL